MPFIPDTASSFVPDQPASSFVPDPPVVNTPIASSMVQSPSAPSAAIPLSVFSHIWNAISQPVGPAQPNPLEAFTAKQAQELPTAAKVGLGAVRTAQQVGDVLRTPMTWIPIGGEAGWLVKLVGEKAAPIVVKTAQAAFAGQMTKGAAEAAAQLQTALRVKDTKGAIEASSQLLAQGTGAGLGAAGAASPLEKPRIEQPKYEQKGSLDIAGKVLPQTRLQVSTTSPVIGPTGKALTQPKVESQLTREAGVIPGGQTKVPEYQGGQISFAGEAGKIPNVRQQAQKNEPPASEQERLMQGQFVPAGKIPSERLSAIREGLKRKDIQPGTFIEDKVQPVPESPKVPEESIFTPEFERFKSWVSTTRDRLTLEKTAAEWNKQAPKTERDLEGQRLVKERLAALAAERAKTSKPWPPPEKYPRTKFYEGGGNTKQPEGNSLGTVSDVLKRISENKDSSFNELAGKLHEIADKEGLAVKVFRDPKMPAWLLGRYSPREDNIVVSAIHGETDHTHIHEIIHALTNKKLSDEITLSYKAGARHQDALRNYLMNGKNEAVKSLILMYHTAMKSLPHEAQVMYGMSDFQEFMAEGFSNPEFQRYLRREKAPLGNKSLWEKFKEAVKKLLGLKDVDDTLLSNVIDATGELSHQTRAEAQGGSGGETTARIPDVASESENLANTLLPALKMKDGSVIPGSKGDTHSDIKFREAKKGNLKPITDEPEHGFVGPEGKFLDRSEAAKVVGETTPLQSERLKELQGVSELAPKAGLVHSVNKTEAKGMPGKSGITGIPTPTPEGLGEHWQTPDGEFIRASEGHEATAKELTGVRIGAYEAMYQRGYIRVVHTPTEIQFIGKPSRVQLDSLRDTAIELNKKLVDDNLYGNKPRILYEPHGMPAKTESSPSNPKTAWLYKPVDGKPPTAHDLLLRIASDPDTHGKEFSALASLYAENFPQILQTVEVNIDEAAPGFGRAGFNVDGKIYLNMKGDDWEAAPKVLHEASHAALADIFDAPRTRLQRAAKTTIENMFKLAKAYLPDEVREFNDNVLKPYYAKNYDKISTESLSQLFNKAGLDYNQWNESLYALINPHEYLAVVSHSPDFRAYLNGIKVEGTTVLGKLKAAFMQMLGIQPGTALEKTFEAIQGLADESTGADVYESAANKVNAFRAMGMVPKLSTAIKSMQDDLKDAFEHTKVESGGFKDYLKRAPTKDRQAQLMDASDNDAVIGARTASKWLKYDLPNKLDQEALTFLIEAKQTGNSITKMKAQVGAKNKEAYTAMVHAELNEARLSKYVNRYTRMMDAQQQVENLKGIGTDHFEGYVRHEYDEGYETIFGTDRSGGGVTTSFEKGRTFKTFADAIAAGYKPKTFNAADLAETRLRAGMKLVNRVSWGEALASVPDPVTGKPLAAPMQAKKLANGKEVQAPPTGYSRVQIIPHVDLAIHDSYKYMAQALTGTGAGTPIFRTAAPLRFLLGTEGKLKHGILLFDTYHMFRVALKQAFMMNKIGYEKGLSLLEYNEPTIWEMVKQGDLTQDQAKTLLTAKPLVDRLVKNGLNIGRVSDNLNDIGHGLPILRILSDPYNKWVFERMSRGVMTESAMYEVDKQQTRLGRELTDEELGAISKKVNTYYGNIGRQGTFKNQNFQDAARVMFLAPQWVESMVRTEAGAYGDVAKAAVDPDFYKTWKIGMMGRSVGKGVAAFFVANQLMNLYLNGQFTWQNKENKDLTQKFDVIFPMGDKGEFLRWNPFSTVAEVTHNFMQYNVANKGDFVGTTARIFGNKESPLFRATATALTGVNYKGEKLLTAKEKLGAAATSLLPTPILGSGAARTIQSGSVLPIARNVASSLGFKMEPSTYKEARENRFEAEYGTPESKGSFQDRRAFEAKEKAGEPLQSPTDRLAMQERSDESRERARREIEGGLSKSNQAWLKSQNLELPEVEDVLASPPRSKLGVKGVKGVNVYGTPPRPLSVQMTSEEATAFHTQLAKAYNQALDESKQIIESRPDQASKKATLDAVLTMARKRVQREVQGE